MQICIEEGDRHRHERMFAEAKRRGSHGGESMDGRSWRQSVEGSCTMEVVAGKTVLDGCMSCHVRRTEGCRCSRVNQAAT